MSGGAVEYRTRWVAALGTHSYGNPVVADGRVYCGTNNANPLLPAYRGDRGILACFSEKDGTLLWQLTVPKISRSQWFNGDRRHVGICSSPAVEAGRAYVVTNRCEVLCLDADGLTDGNDRPFTAEAAYVAKPVDHRVSVGNTQPLVTFLPSVPAEVQPKDADIIWRFDMISGVSSWPQDIANCSPLIHGDLLFVGTSNGICDYRLKRTALYPQAPSLIALNKHTGALVAVDREGIAGRTWHGQWSSPALGTVNGAPLVFYGGGDGVCYAFDPKPIPGDAGQVGILRTVWVYNCNPPDLKLPPSDKDLYGKDGEGPSGIIATPVFYRDKVYVAIGQDPNHGPGKGCLSCIDATGAGDITESGKVWEYRGIGRSISTVAIAEGLVFAADYAGTVHCLDADTGELQWTDDAGSPIWGSFLVADGKAFIATERGELRVYAVDRRKHLLSHTDLEAGRLHSTPVAANGTLFVMADRSLRALVKPLPADVTRGTPAADPHGNGTGPAPANSPEDPDLEDD